MTKTRRYLKFEVREIGIGDFDNLSKLQSASGESLTTGNWLMVGRQTESIKRPTGVTAFAGFSNITKNLDREGNEVLRFIRPAGYHTEDGGHGVKNRDRKQRQEIGGGEGGGGGGGGSSRRTRGPDMSGKESTRTKEAGRKGREWVVPSVDTSAQKKQWLKGWSSFKIGGWVTDRDLDDLLGLQMNDAKGPGTG
ncbi:hypothetical protein C8R42DRAFT_648498 [Lentinula raphanica]|nr:hypothetical protein C8R42DRAFT_648498 [Lentinula raphanica]